MVLLTSGFTDSDDPIRMPYLNLFCRPAFQWLRVGPRRYWNMWCHGGYNNVTIRFNGAKTGAFTSERNLTRAIVCTEWNAILLAVSQIQKHIDAPWRGHTFINHSSAIFSYVVSLTWRWNVYLLPGSNMAQLATDGKVGLWSLWLISSYKTHWVSVCSSDQRIIG